MKGSASESKPFQRRNSRLSRSKFKWPFLTDSDVELFMYLFKVLGSAHEKSGVWTGPAVSTFANLSKTVNGFSNSPINLISNKQILSERSYHIPRSFHDATCFVRGFSTLMDDGRMQVHNLYLPAVLHNSANTKVQVRSKTSKDSDLV